MHRFVRKVPAAVIGGALLAAGAVNSAAPIASSSTGGDVGTSWCPSQVAAAIDPAAPPNDECGTAMELPLTPWNTTVSVVIDTRAATPSAFAPCYDQGDRTVWFTMQSMYRGFLYLSSAGTDYAHVIHPFSAASDACSTPLEPGRCFVVSDPPNNTEEFQSFSMISDRMVIVVGAPRGSAGGTLRLLVRYVPDLTRVLVGFGDGATDGGWFAYRGYAPALDPYGGPIQINWPAYNAVNGETLPAIGNLDADPAEEVVVGLGRGGGGFFFVFDDALTRYAPLGWGRVPWPAYAGGDDGSTRPAIGDVDGDGVGEIVVGLGRGGGGYLAILNGPQQRLSLRTWIRVGWPAYDTANGETFPAAGDLDGDSADEIAIGLGSGGGGYVAIRDDEATGIRLMHWVNAGWSAYNVANGETHPAVGNLDADAIGELLVGLGDYPAGGTWLRAFDDSVRGFSPVTWLNGSYAAYPGLAGRAAFPAIGEFR